MHWLPWTKHPSPDRAEAQPTTCLQRLHAQENEQWAPGGKGKATDANELRWHQQKNFRLLWERSEIVQDHGGNAKRNKQSQNKSGVFYSAVVGNATAGKRVDVPVLETKRLGIRVKGIPEAENENADKRLATDRTEINSLVHYLGVESKITKLSRVGQYKNKGPRTILFDLETQVAKDQAVKSAYKLKTYRIQSEPIFLSAELNKDDAMKENEALKLRRQLIDKGIDPKILRVRNLTLQKLRNGVWSTISDITESDWLSSEPSTAHIIEIVTLLSFNVRSLLDPKRRAALANCLLPLDYDILCLTETWLTENVSNFSIFLNNFEIFRRDRTPTQSTVSTKHGGVLIAIRKYINH